MAQSSSAAQRRARFLHGGRDGQARRIRAVRADGAIRPGARARGRGGARRGARLGVAARRARRRPGRVRRLGAGRRRRDPEGPRARRARASRRPTCRPATRSFSRWRSAGPRCSAPRRSSSASTRSTTPATRTAGRSTSRRSSAGGAGDHAAASKGQPLEILAPLLRTVEGRDHPRGPRARAATTGSPTAATIPIRPGARAARATAAGCARAASRGRRRRSRSLRDASRVRDRASLLHRLPTSTEFDANVIARRASTTAGPPSCSTARRSTRPPAASRSTPGTLGDAAVVDVVDRTTARSCTWSRAKSPRDRCTDASTGRAGSSTCSSTPASTCCRRRSIALFGARTESFHLGSVSSTIDLAGPVTPARDRARPRTRPTGSSGRIVPVTVRFADAEEAARLPLRKESARDGTLRLIEVDGLRHLRLRRHARRDAPARSASSRSSASERFRGGSRVEFVCGVRALRRIRSLRDSVAASVRLVSVLPGRVARRDRTASGETKDVRRQLKGARRGSPVSKRQPLLLERHLAATRGRGRGARRMGSGRTEDHRLGDRRAGRAHCGAVRHTVPRPSSLPARPRRRSTALRR